MPLQIKSKTPISPEEAKTLINDATETVSRLYFDAYGNGFSKAKWAKATQAALAKDFKYREDIYGGAIAVGGRAVEGELVALMRPGPWARQTSRPDKLDFGRKRPRTMCRSVIRASIRTDRWGGECQGVAKIPISL